MAFENTALLLKGSLEQQGRDFSEVNKKASEGGRHTYLRSEKSFFFALGLFLSLPISCTAYIHTCLLPSSWISTLLTLFLLFLSLLPLELPTIKGQDGHLVQHHKPKQIGGYHSMVMVTPTGQ